MGSTRISADLSPRLHHLFQFIIFGSKQSIHTETVSRVSSAVFDRMPLITQLSLLYPGEHKAMKANTRKDSLMGNLRSRSFMLGSASTIGLSLVFLVN